MQFTKAEEYGMHGILYLAQKDRSVVTPLSEISDAQAIPEKFLAKIFQSLSKAGIVRSHRGVRGGFTLAMDPREIKVKDVLETIQGPYCLMKGNSQTHANEDGFCALRELVLIAERRLVEVFEQHTLADLLRWQAARAVQD
jgi:Rrf2 family iron-sulfur cluster assembly transcriptional regulator